MNLARLTQRIFELDGGHRAFDFGLFEIRSAFQPIYAINNNAGMLYGVEALARPIFKGKPIEPMDFRLLFLPSWDPLALVLLADGLFALNVVVTLLSLLTLFTPVWLV